MRTYLIQDDLGNVATLLVSVDDAAGYARLLSRRLLRPVSLWGEHRGVTFHPDGRALALPSGERLDV